jgi:hypothetical protein
MRRITQIVAGPATIWLGFALCSHAYNALSATPDVQPPKDPPSIERIRELSELTVLEIEATKIVTTVIRGHTGSTTAVVLVHGTATYGVDLEAARYARVDREQQELILALPVPTVRRVAINPQTSQMLSCQRSGLWQLATGPAWEDTALSNALAIGHDRLARDTSNGEFTSRAKRQAEAAIGRFIGELGWTLSEVRWQE